MIFLGEPEKIGAPFASLVAGMSMRVACAEIRHLLQDPPSDILAPLAQLPGPLQAYNTHNYTY